MTVTSGALVLHDAVRRAHLDLQVLVDGHPALMSAEQATPTGSHVRASAGDLVTIELARRGPRDVVARLALDGPAEGVATIDVLVTLGADAPGPDELAPRPRLAWETTTGPADATVIRLDPPDSSPWWLTDANRGRIQPSVRPAPPGSPATLVIHHHVPLSSGERTEIRLRLAEADAPPPPVGPDAEATLGVRARESDAWLTGSFPSPGVPAPLVRRLAAELLTGEPRTRLAAALDAVALATLDPRRARDMLLESLAAWAHDAGPQTEAPGAPPLEAWATLRVHDLLLARTGHEDLAFLQEASSRLLALTAWWVDQLDLDGRNALHGGLPALDRPRVLPRGVVDDAPGLAHANGAAWLAPHMVSMLRLATTIACIDAGYEDMAVTFLDTVVNMIDSLDAVGDGLGMWDQGRGAYLDVARAQDGSFRRIPARSMLSLVPLLAVTVIPGEALERLPALAARVDATLAERPELSGSIIRGRSGRRDRGDVLVSVANRSRLAWALEHVLDAEGFLSPYGIRTLSRAHVGEPVHVDMGGTTAEVRYHPAGARDTDGAPLWQGQVSVTLTCLLADALRAHGGVRGSPLLLEYPTGSGRMVLADEVADDLVARVLHALGHLAADVRASQIAVSAIDAESGGPARPRGTLGRSSLPLAYLSAARPTR
ncbi:MAG: hypothetical protein ABWZ82_05395 [Candidatus Limnocylindrales bacterium]